MMTHTQHRERASFIACWLFFSSRGVENFCRWQQQQQEKHSGRRSLSVRTGWITDINCLPYFELFNLFPSLSLSFLFFPFLCCVCVCRRVLLKKSHGRWSRVPPSTFQCVGQLPFVAFLIARFHSKRRRRNIYGRNKRKQGVSPHSFRRTSCCCCLAYRRSRRGNTVRERTIASSTTWGHRCLV